MSFNRSSQRGFTMALVLALAVVMGLMLMKAGPALGKEVQRENEAELIFRGEAIASALKLYFAKTHRYPKDLDEVMKLRPRVLRQKYTDPITASGDWEFLTQVQAGASGNTEGLPIVGVRTRSPLNSIHIYQSKTQVHDWLFSADQNLLNLNNNLNQIQGLTGGAIPVQIPVSTPTPGK